MKPTAYFSAAILVVFVALVALGVLFVPSSSSPPTTTMTTTTTTTTSTTTTTTRPGGVVCGTPPNTFRTGLAEAGELDCI